MSEEQKPMDQLDNTEKSKGFEFDWSSVDDATRIKHEDALLGMGKYKNLRIDFESGRFVGAKSIEQGNPVDRTLVANMILVDGWPKDERIVAVMMFKSLGSTESGVRLYKVKLEPKVGQGSYLSDSEIADKSRILLDPQSKVSVDVDNKNIIEIAADSDDYLSLPDETIQMIYDIKPEHMKIRDTNEMNQTRVVQPVEDRSNEHGSPTMPIKIDEFNFD